MKTVLVVENEPGSSCEALETNMTTVLIVDGDLGFVLWLAKTLADAGFRSIPATRLGGAALWVGKVDVNLLIVNPTLTGAADFVQTLRRSQPHLKVITVGGTLQGGYVSVWKPLEADERARLQWLELVQNVTTLDPAKAEVRHGGGASHSQS